jgi:hypothetical protein
MTASNNDLTGVIHGKTIELDHDVGLPDGQPVRVTIQPVPANPSRLPPGEGIRRSAGSWGDDPAGLDQYLEQLRQDRERDRPPIEP